MHDFEPILTRDLILGVEKVVKMDSFRPLFGVSESVIQGEMADFCLKMGPEMGPKMVTFRTQKWSKSGL